MIISASYKTDIPAFFPEWFMNRLRAGAFYSLNPYNRQVSVFSLAQVEGLVFWTKNLGPLLPRLPEVAATLPAFYVTYTITGYPGLLEPGVPPAEEALAHCRNLAAGLGPGRVVWRYDPIIISNLTPAAWHRANFARLASGLSGVCDQVVVSFYQHYPKAARRLGGAAGFARQEPSAKEKQALLLELAQIAAGRGICLSLCAQRELLPHGLADAVCIDPARLSRLGGRPIAPAGRAHRKNCGCAPNRDIGVYNTCGHGCLYCYARAGAASARANRQRHNPTGRLLIPDKSAPPPARQPSLF